MAKVLHIGGVDSPHVFGIVEQLATAGYEQTILSYPAQPHECHKKHLNGVSVYYHNYPEFFTGNSVPPTKRAKLKRSLKFIIDKEKPDIIHGHYLSKCAVAVTQSVAYSHLPAVVMPWIVHDITNKPRMKKRVKQCLDSCQFVLCNNRKFTKSLLKFYNQPASKDVFCGPPIRLYLYDQYKVPDTTVPKVYLAKSYHQPLIIRALRTVFAKRPQTKVTALSNTRVQDLAKRLNIYNKIDFLPEVLLDQPVFARKIQQHNIVVALSKDHGTSGTTIQAAYSGAVTLSHRTKWDDNVFTHNHNILKCKINATDIANALIYAIDNRTTLCKKFKDNNKFLKAWDATITGKNLLKAYSALLESAP